MARIKHPQVVTANALVEGDVIYFTADDTWVRALNDAEVHTDPDIAAARLDVAARQTRVIAGAYLMNVEVGENGPAPVHFRETFRSVGPSNYQHGKQVGQQPGPDVDLSATATTTDTASVQITPQEAANV